MGFTMKRPIKLTCTGIGVIIMLLPFIGSVLVSCSVDQDTHTEWQRQQNRHFAERVTKVVYEGHSYLLYKDKDGNNYGFAGITHDENCLCRKVSTSRDSIPPSLIETL